MATKEFVVPQKSRLSRLQRTLTHLVLASLGCAIITSPSPAQPEGTPTSKDSPIKIGFITSRTGGASAGAEEMVNGIKLSLEQCGNRIAGRRVELVVENDESNPATALAKVRKLIEQDHVSVIAGIILSHIAYRVAPIVDKYKVPLILPVSAADDLTQRKRSEWVIRTGCSASQATHPFGEWAYKSLGYRRVCILGLDYPFGYELAGGFQRTFEAAGGKIVQKIWAPLGFTDFREYIRQIRKDADAVYMCTALAAAGTIIKQYREIGPKLPIIASGPALDENLLESMGDSSLGCISVLFYSAALDTPANKSFTDAYRKRYGRDTSHLCEAPYTTGIWIKKAAEAVHGDVEDRTKFLHALKSVNLATDPRGPVTLDAYSNPIENIYVRKVQRVNGHLQNTVIHTFPKVSQFWTYNPEQFMAGPPYDRDYPPCRYCSEPTDTK